MVEAQDSPYSQESEMIVLGSMFTSLQNLKIGADSLGDTDFYFTEHQTIFQVLKRFSCSDKPADIHLVAEELKRQDKLSSVGGISYLTTLAQYAGTAAFLEEYIELIKDKSALRRVIGAAQEIVRRALSNPEDVQELLDDAQAKLHLIAQRVQVRRYVSVRDVLLGLATHDGQALIKHFEQRFTHYQETKEEYFMGLPTGFTALDKQVTLLMPTSLVIIAARPAMGKTALALTMIHHLSVTKGIPTGLISLEMGGEQIVERLYSIETGLDGESLKRGKFDSKGLESLKCANQRLMEIPCFIVDGNCSSITQLVQYARRLKEEQGIQILFVDYVQLLGSDRQSDNRQYEVAEVSRKLKALAIELNVPIVCLSQLSRKVEERQDKRPMMSDLRDSGQLEQDADAILFIYRPGYYNKTANQETTDVFLGKNRHGGTPSVSLNFAASCGRFSDQHSRRLFG